MVCGQNLEPIPSKLTGPVSGRHTIPVGAEGFSCSSGVRTGGPGELYGGDEMTWGQILLLGGTLTAVVIALACFIVLWREAIRDAIARRSHHG